ncbi:hypothetical protein SAMN05428962_1959 [Paenibacillus sp. BC26]|nr:hypothetical protein SAMN05428962_1959 [Paenibacillus sp. BC26]
MISKPTLRTCFLAVHSTRHIVKFFTYVETKGGELTWWKQPFLHQTNPI